MKWENCDINVVKQANVSKLSIGTPVGLFELFFDDALVDC